MDRDELIQRHTGKAGLRGKIDAMCIYCIYDPKSGLGNYRQQITACTSYHCPLYSVRPLSKPKQEV